MKFFGVIVLLAVAASSQAELDVRSKRSTINDNLVAMLESFKETMKTGSDDLGIPVLDTFEAKSISLDVNQTLATLAGSLTNLAVSGLSEFSIDTLTFSLIGVKFTFAFTWPSIIVNTGYKIDGSVASLLPIYGEGDLGMEVKNLVVSGSGALSVSGSYLYMRSLQTAVALDSVDFQATGILNDDDVSALLSAVTSDLVPQLVQDYQLQITDLIDTIITDVADGYLGTMTMADLLALIRG